VLAGGLTSARLQHESPFNHNKTASHQTHNWLRLLGAPIGAVSGAALALVISLGAEHLRKTRRSKDDGNADDGKLPMILLPNSKITVAIVATALVTLTSSVSADIIKLKSGGVLRGQIPSPKDSNSAAPHVIKTLTGAVVEVAPDEVESVTKRRVVIEEYEVRAGETADTIESQWGLAEWCRERSLTSQRRTHLERIVEFDPNHERARRGLGHIYEQGRWTTQDEIMMARGYVRHKGRWVLPQELELMEQEQRETEAEKSWFKKIKMWQGWLADDGKPDRQKEARNGLAAITDPQAIPALAKTFSGSLDENLRLMYVGILTQINHEKAAGALVFQSLQDDIETVRTLSVGGIRPAHREKALRVYVNALKHDFNPVVQRAADALGTIGDESVVPALINALVTSHRFRVAVPQTPYATGTTDGNPVSGAISFPQDIAGMLLTGQLPFGVERVMPGADKLTKTVVVSRELENPNVLAALQSLTGSNFGYDETRWKRWWNEKSAGANGSKTKTKR